MRYLNDHGAGILLFVLAIAYGWAASQFPLPFGRGTAVGPETFLHLLAVGLGGVNLYLLLRPELEHTSPEEPAS